LIASVSQADPQCPRRAGQTPVRRYGLELTDCFADPDRADAGSLKGNHLPELSGSKEFHGLSANCNGPSLFDQVGENMDRSDIRLSSGRVAFSASDTVPAIDPTAGPIADVSRDGCRTVPS
jgi:hypothetical protein